MIPLKTFVSERRITNLLAQIRWRDGVYCPRCRAESVITYEQDKPPVFILADRGSGNRYVLSAKADDDSTIRLLLADRQHESLTVYTDGFRAYELLDEDDTFTHKYVVHGDGEHADGDVHVNTCESHGSLARFWLSPHRGISKSKLTPNLKAFRLRRRVYRKPGKETLKTILATTL